MSHLIECKNISLHFGGIKAIEDINFFLDEGELVGLIGPNGAGKTSFFNILSGVYTPTLGEYFLNGEKITSMKPHKLVKKGLVRTFQNIRLFKQMSVIDNVIAASNFNMKYSIIAGTLRTKSYWQEEKLQREKALELLSIFDLDSVAENDAQSLPYGKQRKLEIARAVATNPKVLLLDEPAAGMNPKETQELMDTISKIRDEFDISILLIEHDMKLVLGLCERLIVLDHGKIIAQGDPEAVVNDSEVIKAYLGEEVAA